MNTALEMIDKLRGTTQSHDRCSVVEVVGHHWLNLHCPERCHRFRCYGCPACRRRNSTCSDIL